MAKVYVVELRDQQLTRTRYPIAVCESEALARQAAEQHFSSAGRPLLAAWTRPPDRGQIVAVLRASFSREYEIWQLTLQTARGSAPRPTQERPPRPFRPTIGPSCSTARGA